MAGRRRTALPRPAALALRASLQSAADVLEHATHQAPGGVARALHGRGHCQGTPRDAPMKIDVAICTWNRSTLLRQTLEHMRGLRTPAAAEWRLLVVDNR